MPEVVNIHGKEYETVASRIQRYRTEFKPPENAVCIETEIIELNDEQVVIRAVIKTLEGVIIGSGIAEEYRNDKNSLVNKTSAVENCETSAIGRALASIGYLSGSYASADEVARAVRQQAKSKPSTQSQSKSKYSKPQFGMVAHLLTQIIPDMIGLEVAESHDVTKLAGKLLKGADKDRASEIISELKAIKENLMDIIEGNAPQEIQTKAVKLESWLRKEMESPE